MRNRHTVVLALFALTFAACSSLQPLDESVTEQIVIDTVNLPGSLWDPFMPPLSEGTPVTIEGRLTIPPTDVAVPGVIITHGCGGVGGAERGWVEDLVEAGYGTLVLDSFGGRGVNSVCTGEETMNVASLLVDLFRAAGALDEHPYIDGSHIAVIGFSFGGRTAIWSAMTRFQELYEGRPLQAHVAFYPSTCFIRLDDEHLVSDNPIRIFHGTEDDWTPIGQCRDFIDRLAARGVDAQLLAYEGARHSFDDQTLGSLSVGHLDVPSPRNCEFIEVDGEIIDPEIGDVAGVNSRCVEIGATFGYDPDAHRAARSDLLEFLSTALTE
jgi:dienelactone hydrolase